jgi:bacteriorhodopsin
MPELTTAQFDLVFNAMSFTIVAMLASFAFFMMVREDIDQSLRIALTLSSIVVGVAAYFYFRMFESWKSAYALVNGVYAFTGRTFNNAYRYADWLLTVPLLVSALVSILGMPREYARGVNFRLMVAAILMIVLGYPGEIANTTLSRAIWGALSTIPFVYILFVLFSELGPAIGRQPAEAQVLVRNIRILLMGTWGFYPLVYLLPIAVQDLNTAPLVVAIQTGYCIADVLAKCGYGVMIYAIGRAKMDAEKPTRQRTTSSSGQD